MRIKWRCKSPAFLLGILLLAGAGLAEAKKRVVVLPFSGPGSGAARAGVVRALGKRVTLINASALDGADGGAELVAACAKAKCDAVLKGQVYKKGRRATLTVTVINGGTGQVIGRRSVGARGIRRIAGAGAGAGAGCLRLIAKGKFQAEPKPAPAPRPAPPPEPVKPPPQPVARAADTSDVPVYRPAAAAEEEGSTRKSAKEKEEDDEEGVTKRSSSGGSWTGVFDVWASIGFSTRRCVLAVNEAAAGGPPDHTYDGAVYPEFNVHLDLFPLAPFMKNFARNIGIGIGYGRHITISTKNPQDPNGEAVETASQELNIDVRLRWAIMRSPATPVVLAFMGFGMRDFTLGDNQQILSSLNYRFFRAGIGGIIPFGTPLAGLHLSADVRPLMAAGSEASDHWGARSGGLGFSLQGGGYGKLPFGLFYFFTIEYLQFGADFAGLDPAVPENCGDASDKRNRCQATNISDRFIRAWVGVGYEL